MGLKLFKSNRFIIKKNLRAYQSQFSKSIGKIIPITIEEETIIQSLRLMLNKDWQTKLIPRTANTTRI